MDGCVGEESFQLWELNRRLEAYLARVKALEEQNAQLSAELGGLRAQSGDNSWRAGADGELAALRALVDQRWREKHAAEVQRDSLADELEGVAGRCQQLRTARERSVEEAARSRRAVEAEQRAQDWLSAQAAELERELEALRAAHEEERASLHAQAACAPRRPAPPRGPPTPAPEVEELARRLGEAWRGAVRGYQERVAHLETSLGQARERLGRAMQGAREGRLELQQLRSERGGLQERRVALEQRLEDRWQERLRATEKFQLAVEALEQEKQGLQSQIAQVLEGRQQLAHLKMSLSLEVATYRTLLEAENSRLQTPGSSFKASLSFQDPKPELYFPGTPEGQRLGPVVLSPTSLPSPLPNTLQTPVPAFLKSQEFLQARTPTLASTPIPPTPQAPCPAANAEARAQDGPCSLLPQQGGRQQAPEPLWDEAQAAITASILPGPEEPGGKQQEASPGQSPEDQASLAPPLSPDEPSLEAKDREPSGSGASSVFQEEGKGQSQGLVEKEVAVEVQIVSSLQQQTWQEGGDLDVKEAEDSQGPLEKETLKAVGETPKPLMLLENQSHEAREREDRESLKSLEEENLETLKSLEKENQEGLRSLEEKDMEAERLLEKEVTELPKSVGGEDSQTFQSLETENQGLMLSREGNLETVVLPEKENQELVRSLEEENLEESLSTLKKETQKPLSSQEAEDQEIQKFLPEENQESLKSLEDESQETFKDNQEPLTSVEENEKTVRPLEKEKQELLKSLEEEEEEFVKTLEKDDQESVRSLEVADQGNVRPLEKENQESLRSLEEEEEKTVRPLEKENQEPLGSLEDQETLRPLDKEDQGPLWTQEEEDQKNVRPPEKENQEPLESLEEEDQKTMSPLEKENQELLRSLEEDQETLKTLEKETQQSLRALGGEGQVTLGLLEKVNPEPLESLGNEQEVVGSSEKEHQELFRSLEGERTEAVRSSDTQNLEPLTSAEEDLEMPTSLEAQESLWSLEERNRETAKPLEKEIQETQGSVEENQETPSPQEKENQETLRPLGEWNPENLRSPEGAGKEGHKDLEKEGSLLNGEKQELLRSLEEEAQELPLSENQERCEAVAVGDQDLGQEAPSSGEGVGDEGEAELGLRKQDGNSAAEAWSTGSAEPEEQRVPAEGASGREGVEGPQDLEGPPEQVGTPGLEASQEMAEVPEPQREDEHEGPWGDQASLEVTWGAETVKGGSAAGAAGAELGLEQEVGGLEDQEDLAHPALEEAVQPPSGEDSLEAESAEGLEGPGQDHMGATLPNLPSRSRDLGEPPKGWEESEPEAPVGAEDVSPTDAPQPTPSGSEDAQDTQPVLGPTQPQTPTPILEDFPGLQNEGGQEAVRGLQERTEALRKVEGEQEEFGPEEIPEDLQEEEEEEEESRAESEADELGETLPDSTPLGLYLRSPSSPGWDVVGEQRPSPQGEARKEGWDPAVPVPGPHSEEEEKEENGEEDRGQDSELSDEFEDLQTEASFLPGVPRKAAEPLGQVAQLLEPAVWDRDGESDGFADEESGEEAEEEEEGREPGSPRWGSGSTVGGLQALSSSQREDHLAPEALGISVPWDDGLQGAMADPPVTALETESQDSAEPSGSEESDSAPWEKEDQVLGPLETPGGLEDTGLGGTHSVNGGPNLEESEHTSGRVVNGLEQSKGGGHRTPEPPDGEGGTPSQKEEGVALKTPWAGTPVHLGPSQFLKFAPRGGDGDSWSSGED
ncbi:PREDICTED: nestin [Chinchilla lanigera]|uniref:Nestin n=1 Tax=Chinchilla lanigera TaxID=34839 RepID=A0A8C2UT64_CHILA|nr:PREDICTED: nestin [Chinchilla lanigera]